MGIIQKPIHPPKALCTHGESFPSSWPSAKMLTMASSCYPGQQPNFPIVTCHTPLKTNFFMAHWSHHPDHRSKFQLHTINPFQCPLQFVISSSFSKILLPEVTTNEYKYYNYSHWSAYITSSFRHRRKYKIQRFRVLVGYENVILMHKYVVGLNIKERRVSDTLSL